MPAQTWVEPVVLEGARVRLEPLRADHLADLARVAFDLPLWQWTIMGPQDEAGLRRWVETALANQEAGTERPFATIDRASGPGDRQQPLHVDRAGAPAPRDRLDVGRHGLPADRARTARPSSSS